MAPEEIKAVLLLELVEDLREQEKRARESEDSAPVVFLAGLNQGLRVALRLLGMSAREIQEAVARHFGLSPAAASAGLRAAG